MSHNLASVISRRTLLKTASCGFGYLAFMHMATEAAAEYQNPLAPKLPHFTPKAKRVIFLAMQGGPSHVDTFDYKPALARDAGKDCPGETNKGRKLYPSPFKFPQHGQSGLPISEIYPHLSQHADDICLLNGMYCEIPNHPQAFVQLHTGSFAFVRPSVGAWMLYGLGSESQELPGFITINPQQRVGGAQNYGNAFLPAMYQGTVLGQDGQSLASASLDNITNSRLSTDLQRKQIDLVQEMNRDLLERKQVNPEIDGVIESYELGFRMQGAIPRVMDIKDESPETLRMYGIGEKSTDNFGRQCLLARRFAEAGVRYIELSYTGWDQHSGLKSRLSANALGTDQPMGALITDLKQRGMLDDTLIVWSGEFGRTPGVRRDDGRDHNSTGFSTWMCGGGVKGGQRYGATDEYGIAAEENKVHFHDLHATMLHLMGLDHKKLTYRYAGRDFRLTDVYGKVLSDVVA